MSSFVDFSEAMFRAGATEAHRPREEAGLLGSLVFRPAVFRRNEIDWIAACAWRARAKADDIVALKLAKRALDRRLIGVAAELVAALIRQLHGGRSADAITTVPCGHSRRPDCLGKQIAQAVGGALGLAFLQVFADRPCSGVSHPKEFAKLPPLEQIADPRSSMILVDDLATSGWHVEESLTALRRLGASTSAFVWIGGTVT
jgi:predicted amidophosphoribosyltransferase